MQTRRIVPAAAALALVVVALPATAATAVARPVSLVAYTGDDLHAFSAFTALDPVAAAQRVTVDLVLRRPDAAAEAAYETAEYTPGTAEYHQYLTPAQFAARFGVAASTYDEALSFATAHGMTLQSTTPSHDTLVLNGTAAQAEATFSTTLRNYSLDGTAFFANETSPMVPADLPIAGLFGLETMHRAHDEDPKQTDCSAATNECLGDLTPQDMWSLYDQPSTDTGQGVKMSLFGEGAYDYVIKDLRQFEAENHLPTIPVSVVLADGADNGTNYTDTSGDGEWQLDTQSSSGMAPNAKELDLIWGSTYNYTSLYNILSTWVNLANGSNAASASYSDCEPFPASDQVPAALQFDVSTPAYVMSSEQELTQAVMEGKTLFSSAGDTGGSCAPLPVDANGVATEGTVDVGYPASSPNAVGVGGTVLYGTDTTPPTRADEYGWVDGGGGPSDIFPEPAYQKTVTETVEATDQACKWDVNGNPIDPLTAPTCRKVPDVSAVSGDIVTNGYTIVDDGSDTATGGTSLSSPLTLGLWTRVQSGSCATSSGGRSGLGFANAQFYAHTADFFDPGGTTDSMPSDNQPWVSGPGYDYVTGLGVIDVARMMADLDKSTSPCATAPTDQAAFPPTSVDGIGTPAAALPEATVPAVLLVVAVVLGGLVLARRRRRTTV